MSNWSCGIWDSVVRDLLESEKSILILGPGVGKTIIREIAGVLADEMEKRVVIIDTSNEIAGDSDIPHSGIGRRDGCR
jgi:stage III sporulation protein SpoIIIAA